MYAQTCLRQENRIRELESCNNRVQRELKEVQSNSIDKAEMLVEEFEKEILTSPTISDADVQAVALTRDREQFLVLQSKLVEIEAELAMKSTELDKVSKTTKAKEEEFNEEIADLLNENSRLQEDSMNNRMELEMSRALVKEFEEDMASTQKELEESQKRNRLLKDEIATLVPQYQNVLSHSGTMIDAKANDFESKLAFLQETCKLQQDATSAAEKQAQESNDLITRLEKEIMGLERNLMESEQRNEILKEEKVKFSSYKEECDSTVQELMRTLQLKENTIAECKTAMTKLQKEKDQFTEEIDLMETQFGKLNYSKMGLEQTLAQTERELADTKGEVSSIHGRLLEQLESGNTYPRIEIEKKDEELQAVIENLGVAQNEVLRLETDLKFLRSFLFAVLVKFKSLEGVNVMAEDRSRHLEKKMEEASSLLRSSREKDMRIESLYSDLSLIEKEKESILSEMKFWKISSEGLEETFRGKTLICANMRSRIDMLTKMKKNIEEGMTRETERNSLSIASLQNNIQALKCDINAKDKELLRFASEIKVVKGDLSRSTKLTKKLEIDLDTKFEELEGTVCRLNECNETATLLKNESELLRNQTSKLESELESKSRELKVSSYTMEAMNSQLLDFQNEIISLSSSKASISSLLRTSDDQAADLQTQMDICQRKLTEESFLLATAQEHVSALEAERKELKIEKSHLIEENQALIKTHAVSESAWKGEVEGLTLKLNSNAQELMDLKQKCTEFESEMVELKSKLIFAKKDGSKTSELLLAAKGEVESLEAEKAGIQKRLKHLQKEKCAVEEKLLGENHFLEAKIKELEIVLSKVELNRRNEITALEKKAQSDENSLQLEITMLRNDYNSMLSCKEETHSSLEKYRTSMTKSLLKANATIASLRAQLKGTQSDHEELRSSFQWTEKERENLVMRTAELQFSHSESLSKNLRLEENISLLENTVVSLDKNNSLLQKSLDGKEEELAANAIQLISRAAIIDELRCELTENHYGIKTIRELCLQTGKTDQKCEQEDGLHTIFSLVKSLIDSEDRCCTELENVEATNKTLKEKIQELENNLLSSQEIVSTLEQLAESRRTDHEDEIALLSKNVNELEGLVDHISKEKQFLKDGFDSTEEELKDLRKSSHHLHVALDNAKQSAEEEKNDFAAVSRKLNDEMSALENKLSFHFAETTRLEEEIEKCTRSRNEEKEDGDKVRSDLNRMEVFVSELQNTVKDAESRLEKANGSIGYGIEREKSFRGQLAESQELLESWLQIYEKELEDSHLDLVASRRNNSTLEEKTRELTREKEALVEETREAEQTISDLRVEILEIHDELDVSSSEDSVDSILRHLNKDELCAELLIAQEELVEAKSRTSEAEAEAANSCDRLKNFQKDLASLTTEMNALVRRNVALENLMKKTESAKHDAETTANDKVIGLERELETNTSEMMMLSQDYEKLQGRMHFMAEYHAQYERENQEQIVKLQKSQSMLQAECVVNFSRGKHQEQEVSNLRHFKADAEEKISDLQAELERNHEERRKLEESAICKEEHNRVEEHELSNLRHFKADAEEKISDLHAELERRHEERKHLEESVICKEDHYRVEEERLKTILSQQREDVAALRTSSESLELKVDAMRSQLERKDEVISSLLEETKNERKRVVDTEASREMAVAKLAEVSGLLIEKQEDLDSLEKRLAESLDELRKLCEKSDCLADEKEQLKRAYSDGLVVISTLTEKAESLALKAISLRENIEQKEEIVGNMTKEKEADREQLKEIEAMRAEAVKKLVEASSDTILKQEEMISLEERLAGSAVEIKELKKTLEVLTEQKAADEQSLSKLKSAQEEKDNLRTKEINRLKTSVVKLEEINGCLKDQLEASTDAVSELKQKPKGAEETEKRSVETVEYLERELSKKQAVIDHLKKTVLLLESTIAKINLSYSNTLSARPSAELDREDAEMVSELSLITTHLASVKAAFHSQKLVLADLKVSEDLLFEFMKEVLSLAKSAEDEVLDWTRKLQENGLLSDPTQLIIALDLAGVKQPRDYVLDIRRRVESLVPIASESIEELETRHQELLRWQQKRLQPPATPLTPTSFAKGSMSSASKMSNRDVVEEMKIVLKDEILSPCKERAKDVKHSDPKRLQEVLESLETKMDGLLQDLEAANDALEEKDRLVNEMERSTERNEAERRSLEGQLFALEEELQASRLIQEFNMRTDCYDRSSDHQLKEATNHNQMAGARLLSNVLEIRCKLEKATAFRKWSCNVGAMKAASNQKHDAVALAQQLQITREKLIVLKAHLNKGRGSHSGEERKKPRLRRLLSRLDKREKLELLPEEEDEKLDL